MRASAQCMKSLKNMCAVWCLSTPSLPDREALIQHHAFGLPKLVAFQVGEHVCTDIPSLFPCHLCDEELELCPPCRPLQSGHCQFGILWRCGSTPFIVDGPLSADRDAWWWQWCLINLLSFASCCTSFTAVSVLLWQRRVFFGPSAGRSHSSTVSSVKSCD